MPNYSTRLQIPTPLATDPVSAGPSDFSSALGVVDGDWGLEFRDFLAAGVVGYAEYLNASGPSVNASTGVLTFTLAYDVAWVYNSAFTQLNRCALPTSATPLTPGSLPTSGNYRCVGLYITPSAVWTGAGTLSLAVGTQQSTAALALVNPPSQTPSGSLLLQYVVIGNSSGTYSIASTTDERILPLQVSMGPGTGGQQSGNFAPRVSALYVPAWTAASVNPTQGNGTLIGSWLLLGTLVFFRLTLEIGSTTLQGTGAWSFGLPLAAPSDGTVQTLALSFNSSPGVAVINSQVSTTTIATSLTSASGLTTGSIVSITGVYESVA